MEYAARYGNQALETGWDVRPPILNEDGTYQALMAAGGQALADRDKTALGRLDEYAAEAADWRAQLPESSLLSDYEASFVSASAGAGALPDRLARQTGTRQDQRFPHHP